MPTYVENTFKYKVPAENVLTWDTFRGGLNVLLNDTEIGDNELAQSQNLQLIGKGIPTMRPGTDNLFLANLSVATGTVRIRGLKNIAFASGVSPVRELLAMTDDGFLVKKSGASYSMILGASFASGYNVEMAQLYNKVFIASPNDPFSFYSGVTIFPYVGVSRPTGVTATNLSGVSGTFTYSWRVAAVNAVGETLASEAIVLGNLPQDLTTTLVRLNWTTSSPSSGIRGYAVYGRDQGDERYITTVDNSSLRFDDDGNLPSSSLIFPPEADTTGGPKARYIIGHKDKLALAGLDSNPSRLMWSGGGVNVDKFAWQFGGGYVDIDKDSGDVITGIIDSFDSILVFKERSIWQVTLSAQLGIVIPTVKLLTRGAGCVAHRTIQAVENEVFFLSRGGIYTLGYESGILGVLRANEISTKVRPIFENILTARLGNCAAVYFNRKYRLSYPSGQQLYNDREMTFDRERLAWMGPNILSAGPAVYETYIDGNNMQHLIYGDSDDAWVSEISDSFTTDKGVKIETSLLTKRSAFKNPLTMKSITDLFGNFRSITGTINVDVYAENRDGEFSSVKSFTITNAQTSGTGWGFDRWGTARFGNTNGAGAAAASSDLTRRVRMPNPKVGRLAQIGITTSGNNANYQLIALQLFARELWQKTSPISWRV